MSKESTSQDRKIRPWMEYKLHIVVLFLVIIAEWIGMKKFNLGGNVSIVIMPLLYAMVIGLAFYLAKPITFIGNHESKVAEGLMLLFMTPLLAKLAVSSGQALKLLFDVGPAIILQEFGNLGTIFFALPIALLLGFKRESIGMTSSICREPNIGTILDKYGTKSPETRGVLTVYVIGTIIGTVFISLVSSLSTSLPFHPYALAMASGVGSASMNAAALAPLTAIFPDMKDTIMAFSGFSNLISFCFGIYLTMFIGIPLTEKLYYWLEPKIGRTTSASIPSQSYEDEDMKNHDLSKEINKITWRRVSDWIILFVIFSFIVTCGNCVSTGRSFYFTFVGMLILSAMAFASVVLERVLPHHISSILYVSIIGMLLSMPWCPLSPIIVTYVNNVELTSIVTVYLGYVGISIGRDWDQFKKLGWRGAIVTCFVILGTFIGSATIAQLVLMGTGAI
ncbi:DUF3100 domain-containing protein [uncultured Methanobrevibacter sp.]|uniref:DUF3100 domain-containing protein n=1 Tax=uncultured Methanobrevibacter sp. TaxID=253161 RepID=UPI00258CD5E0|nr:DUF3100 domain-containing protein [uncultured Methanobrevibacter sp.]